MAENLDKKIFMLTDGCMWEMNKQNETHYPHSIEVVDMETGQVRYIRSGSRITFVDGNITPDRNQEEYNNQQDGNSQTEKTS